MANQFFGGGVSDNWDTAGNWTSAKPGAADTVVVPASTTRSILTGLNDENAVKLAKMWVQEGYNGNIGASGTELFISADLMKFEGSGQLFWKAGDDVSALAIIKARPATAGLTSVTLSGTGGTDFTAIHVQQGKVDIGAGLDTLALLTVNGDSIVSLGSGTTVTDMRHNAGTMTANSVGATTIICGGIFNLDTVISPATFEVWGGVVNLMFGGTYSNTIDIHGGLVDFTRSAQLKTVDSINIFGGDLKINDNVTLGSATAIKDYR